MMKKRSAHGIGKLMAVLAFAACATTSFAATGRAEIQGKAGKLALIYDVPVIREDVSGPVVVICHGFTSSKDAPVLIKVTEAAVKAGLPVVRFDFNGHGESGGDFSKMTVSSELDDLRRILEWTERQPWCGNILLVGHSQGGVVAAMACGIWEGKTPIRGVLLLAPAGVLGDNARDGRIFDASFDPANPPDIIPLFGGKKRLGGCYVRDAQTLPIYETAAKSGAKGVRRLCVIHGGADAIVPYSYGQRFVEVSAGKDGCSGEFHLLYGVDHIFSGHEAEVADLAVFLLKKMQGGN